MKKKIFIFLPSVKSGGAEKILINIANNISKKKFDLLVCVLNKKGKFHKLLDKSLNIIYLNKSKLIFSIIKLIYLIRKFQPKTILTTLSHSNLIFCLLKKFIFKDIKLIIRETNIIKNFNSNIFFFKRILFYILKKFLYNNADIIVALNQFIKKEIINIGVSKKKIKIIYNPIIAKNFISLTNQKIIDKHFLSNKKIILCIGRLEKHKNYLFLIRMFNLLYKAYNLRLVIIGSGTQLTFLLKLIQKLKLRKYIKIIKYEKNSIRYIKRAKLFILPSEYEGQPNALIESLACGVPSLVSKYPGYSFFNKFRLKYLKFYKTNHSHEFKKKFKTLIQRRKKNKINKKFMECFNIKKNISVYEKLF